MKNYINKNIKNLKAFTMLEILMITLIIGIGLLSIVVAISKAKIITNNTKQHIIATQLAREGVEMVYQIRNTNLLQHPNYKNYCRLNENPYTFCDEHNNPQRMHENNYILTGKILSGTMESLNISDGILTGEQIFNLCLSGGQRTSCPGIYNQTKYGKFLRTIEGKSLYAKNYGITGGLKIVCGNGGGGGTAPGDIDFSCAGDTENPELSLEFQFCSRVEYIGTKTGSVEICGVLTNFFE